MFNTLQPVCAMLAMQEKTSAQVIKAVRKWIIVIGSLMSAKGTVANVGSWKHESAARIRATGTWIHCIDLEPCPLFRKRAQHASA